MRSNLCKPTDHSQIFAIDILRFAAAVLVLAYHFGNLGMRGLDERLAGLIDERLLPTAFRPFTSFGWIGVEIFFVISGYVILISAEHSKTWVFVRKRFLRLAPAAWLCATITLVMLLAATSWDRSTLFKQWLVAVSFSPFGSTIDPAYWTIGIEIAFYGLVATQIGGLHRKARLRLLAVVIGAVSTGFCVAVQFHLAPAQPSVIWTLLLLQHGCFFALGMSIRVAQASGWTPRLIIFCVMLSIACLLEIHAHQDDLTLHITSLFTLPILTFAAAVLFLSNTSRFQEILSGEKAKAFATLLGKTSYPLYLIHQTSGSILMGLLLRAQIGGPAALTLTVFIVIAVAMLIATFAEPALRAYTARSLMNRDPQPDSRPTASPSVG